MDKYEYRVKAEQIVKLVGRRNYIEAMKIADEIDWNRVKNVQMLCTVSDIYAKNERYEESREILYLALERSPEDRIIIYNIVELSLLLGDMKEAVEYFREYSQLAPNDTNIYILKYKLYAANSNTTIETLISILEEFKEQEFHEDWGFELARLYAEGGYVEQCVELCDELDLWFNEGPFVIQALELKSQFAELTPAQQAKLEQSYAMMDEAEHMQQMFAEEEQSRMQEEQARIEEEQLRMQEEQARMQEEQQRMQEEQARMQEEQARIEEEQARIQQEKQFRIQDEYNLPENEEDIFFAGKMPEPVVPVVPSVSAGISKGIEPMGQPADEVDSEEPDTWTIPDRSIVIEEGEANEPLEIVDNTADRVQDGSDEEDTEPEIKQNHKPEKKSHSGGFLSTIGRLGKKLVEPASDYDVEEDDEEEEEIYEEDSRGGIEHHAIQEPQEKKFVNSGRFNLDDIAAAQEVYEEINDIHTTPVTEDADDTTKDDITKEPIHKVTPEKKRVPRDTKPFDKVSFKEKKNRKSYEADMEDALKNIDKVVNGNMNISEIKEEIPSNEATPVWNGVSRYDTMNLQKELAKSIQKLLEATEKDDVDSTLEDVKRLVEDSNIPELTETMRFKTVRASMLNNWAKNQSDKLQAKPEIEESVKSGKEHFVKEDVRTAYTAPTPAPRKPEVEVLTSIKLKPTKEDRKRELEQILTLENDGQIGLIMPQEEVIEKQITGQLNIQDVLLEFERQKNSEITEKEKKELENARNKALNETQEFMSQVMDLLSQCLPKCGEDSSHSAELLVRLSKVQQELNSTSDLSQISALNSELADILDKICPSQCKTSVSSEEILTDSEVQESFVETMQPENEEPQQEETRPEEEVQPEEVSAEEEVQPEEVSAEEEVQPEEVLLTEETQPGNEEILTEAEAQEIEEVLKENEEPETEKTDDVTTDDISRMLEEALQSLGQDVQNSTGSTPVPVSAEFEDEAAKKRTSVRKTLGDTVKQSAASLAGLANSMMSNNLDNKQIEALSYFANIPGVAAQVDKLLNEDKSGNENLIITGPDGTGKTSLALRIVKAQHGEDNPDFTIAKIKGASLNSQDLDQVFEQVKGGALIIVKAAALSETTMKKICEKFNAGQKIQIILVTKKKSVERLIGRNPEFMNMFKNSIDLPNYNNDELVEYAKTYAKANNYFIEDMAVLALFSRLGSMQTDHGTPNFNDVKDIIDEAISHAKHRNKKILKRLFGKKNEDSSQYLLEEDFE